MCSLVKVMFLFTTWYDFGICFTNFFILIAIRYSHEAVFQKIHIFELDNSFSQVHQILKKIQPNEQDVAEQHNVEGTVETLSFIKGLDRSISSHLLLPNAICLLIRRFWQGLQPEWKVGWCSENFELWLTPWLGWISPLRGRKCPLAKCMHYQLNVLHAFRPGSRS